MAKFTELQLRKEILDAIAEIGLKDMFPIQEAAIPHMMNGEDVIGQAHTGTGKTAAFALPILNKVETGKRIVVALILVPTRELAVQVSEDVKRFSKYTSHKTLAVYGGQSFNMQLDALRWGKDIIVATPGRLMDFIRRGLIDLSHVKFVILDEADRMLDMGFIEDIRFIMGRMPQKKQVALFSATMPEEIMRLTTRYMNKPVKVLISKDELSAENIEQTYLVVEERSKFHHLAEMLKAITGKTLIFCSTKMRTRRLSHDLYKSGFRTVEIHGDLSQNQRDRSIYMFKSGKTDILVATDVASRGLDIPKVEHVINYDVPIEPMAYIHRIGRTARAGASGKAITLVSQNDYDYFQNVLRQTKAVIKRLNEEMGISFEIRRPEPRVQRFERRPRFGGRRPRRDFRRPQGRRGSFRRRY